MTEAQFTAQMSMRQGRWRLYVALLNTTDSWPEYPFGTTMPTLTERAEALNVLGFEPVPGAVWEWTEDSETHDDPASAVVLIAAIRLHAVRERVGR
ncbi:DUF6303 family protein [Streptomyces sp. NPDC005731]|uniref:DUF6303 family protein n=1 Tax=Streptomyces sp. NPDC005731 TaxID=3157056 RepID=UPI0033DC899E